MRVASWPRPRPPARGQAQLTAYEVGQVYSVVMNGPPPASRAPARARPGAAGRRRRSAGSGAVRRGQLGTGDIAISHTSDLTGAAGRGPRSGQSPGSLA